MDETSFFDPVLDERSQAKARLFFGIIGFAYVYFLKMEVANAISYETYVQLLAMLSTSVIYALFLLIYLKFKTHFNPARQIFSICLDILLISYAFYLAGEWATLFISLFLWIIIGNGIRYGLPYLLFSMILGTLCFFIVIKTSDYWIGTPMLSMGLLLSFIVLPLFFMYLLNNLHKTRLRLEQELKKTAHLAHYDVMTELPNRHSFTQRLHHELQVAKRNHSYFFILYMDLDGFKEINDTYGHDVGDKVLFKVAQRLKHCVRDIDLIARIGGDEFACVSAASNIVNNSKRLQQRLLTSISKPMQINGITLTIGVSIGQACYPDDGQEFEQLLIKSDQNMYQKKQLNKQHLIEIL